tara:strand:+ start:3088 stop:3267 length:180 start_codon:yes stop_codon:yes gene_type:complete
VNAIYAEDDLPEKFHPYIELNAKLAKKWPNITQIKAPPDDADKWADVEDKRQYLDESEQ